MSTRTPNMSPQSSKGYTGKRHIWQWVVLYLIIAAIIYGLIYYFFSGSSSIDMYSY